MNEKNITRRGFLKLVGGLAVTAVGPSLTACKNNELDIIDNESIYDIAFNNGINSLFDDIFVDYPNINLISFHERKEIPIDMSIVDASNMMEKSIKMSKLFEQNSKYLKKFDEDNIIEELDRENEAIDLDFETVSSLFENLKSKSLTPQEKEESARILNYLKKYYNTWIEKNNPKVSENLLLILFKSFGCEIENLSPEEYGKVTVEPRLEPKEYCELTISRPSDKKEEIKYKISEKESGIIYHCLDSLYNCQGITFGEISGYKKTEKEKKRIIEDAIHNLKCGLLCGVKVKDDFILQGQELTKEMIEGIDSKQI